MAYWSQINDLHCIRGQSQTVSAAGWHVNPPLVMGLSILPVAALAALGARYVRRNITRGER